MQISESERAAYDADVESTAAAFCALEPVPTRPFFHEPEDEKQGAGELLVLAVDPQTCVGCGLCVRACPEQALTAVERSAEGAAGMLERRRSWEALPDTSGASLQRAASHPELGLLPAVLLSRHCAQSQAGGGAAAEPGCGQRLAGRLVTALAEHHAQRRVAATLKRIEELRESLAQGLRGALAESLSGTGPETLAEALTGMSRQRLDLADLGSRLDALGAPATLDRRSALRRARAAAELEEHRERISQAADGFGRARFGVVVAAGSVDAWAARFPEHPYFAPLTLASAGEAPELARGIARGLVADHLVLQRALRRAELEAQAPPDRSARLEAIEALGWPDLEPEQRAACPPLLLLGDEGALVEQGFDALTRLLASELPIKVILLDGRGRLEPGPEASLVAMAHRRAFVLAGSPAYPEHLARGVADALAWPGPALVHLHAPSPARHGFAADATLEQARRAVEGRAHVLLRYDPAAEGVFGLRASLEHNPGLADDWGGADFAAWALGEERFAEHFREAGPDEGVPLAEWLALPEPERAERVPVLEADERRLALSATLGAAAAERLAVWGTLRELAGVQSPFTERIRESMLQQIESQQQSRLDALTHEYEGQIAGIRSERDREALARLTERLMALAGYRAPGSPGDKPS
jgi:pyruvate-ferredoxin/flavodoxin oxidoreductase